MSKLPKPKAILFDWDGTLSDSMPRVHAVLGECFALMGLPQPTIAQAHELAIHGRQAGKVAFGMDDEQNKKFFHLFAERYFVFSPDSAAMDGAAQLIDSLPVDMSLGIVTNGLRDLIEAQLVHFGWADRFRVVVCAGEAVRDKPYPDPALLALEKLGIAPGADVWLVGDTRGDVECAKSAGLTSVMLAATDSVDCAPHARIDHLDHLTRHFTDDW